MPMDFEWDAAKASANRRKHGVSFEEAAEAVKDPRAVEEYDFEHSTSTEDRFELVGMSGRGRLLMVVYTQRDEAVRIISARKATRAEVEAYAEAQS
jgi:uncharacterized protein